MYRNIRLSRHKEHKDNIYTQHEAHHSQMIDKEKVKKRNLENSFGDRRETHFLMENNYRNYDLFLMRNNKARRNEMITLKFSKGKKNQSSILYLAFYIKSKSKIDIY